MNHRLRPIGSQDEAIFHTRWGRYSVPGFFPTQWCPAWPTAFRLEVLRWHDNWDDFRKGLTSITNAIPHLS